MKNPKFRRLTPETSHTPGYGITRTFLEPIYRFPQPPHERPIQNAENTCRSHETLESSCGDKTETAEVKESRWVRSTYGQKDNVDEMKRRHVIDQPREEDVNG